jgi:hypothetical protein
MNPQQDYLGPNQNPYDFIMKPPGPPKKRFGLGGLDPMITKILFILGILFVIIAIAALFVNLTAAKRIDTGELISLAQTQEELIRVADAGNAGAIQQTTKNLAITTEFTLKTQQAELLDKLAKQGISVKAKQLGLKQNASIDLKLKEAQQTSTFDVTFSQIIEDELRDYAKTVNILYDKTQVESQRDMFSGSYTETQLLISQVPYTREALGE